jgi:hypothetical protein
MGTETAIQRYVRLLRQLATAKGALFTSPDEPRDDLMAFEELLNDGLITGVRRGDEMNRVTDVYDMRITVKGRLFLEELETKEAAKTSIGLIKQKRWEFYETLFKIAVGGLIVLLGQWLKDKFLGSN